MMLSKASGVSISICQSPSSAHLTETGRSQPKECLLVTTRFTLRLDSSPISSHGGSYLLGTCLFPFDKEHCGPDLKSHRKSLRAILQQLNTSYCSHPSSSRI